MTKTKEEKIIYCREWRKKNRETYLARRRNYYHKNKNKLKDKAKERAKIYYHTILKPKRENNKEFYSQLDRIHSEKRKIIRRNHLRYLREKLGGKCVHCGYNEVVDILQFHHIGSKHKNVTEIQNFKKREKEVENCVLLCPNCHSIETLKQIRKI